ncbi:acyltransferase [Arthrobacter sp. Cr_A7]|uniref:acyltransferase family protein n=1 Tax=Arthrobacter sp. Cr_A7 TaxID=3031017 RepID=UPI0023DAD319|nr:acyltransferase [Arthrobacter sp. Cr_A7]MDF2048419.1 acyltransferase [Arthrobacter sp. Cr_A7]
MRHIERSIEGKASYSTNAAGPVGRIRSLDGLRGVAALVVVIGHSLIVFPWLRYVHTSEDPLPFGTVSWWGTHTPLHLLWAGSEAVYIFFVLSGFVLTLPVLQASSFSWRQYYPRRLARLYLPVWAALAFAVVLTACVSLLDAPTAQVWLAEKEPLLAPLRIVRDAVLLTGVSDLNGPLWSLHWEMLFSLALPAYVIFACRWRSLLGIKVAVVILISILGSTVLSPLQLVGDAFLFMPLFALGALMAVEWPQLRTYALRIDNLPRSHFAWNGLLGLAALVLCSYWLVLAFDPPKFVLDLTRPLSFTGAAVLVFCAAFHAAFRSALEWRAVQWLGRISFSLYLVHGPILEVLNSFLRDDQRYVVMLVGIPVALVLAQLFYIGVERPSLTFSRRLVADQGALQ